MNRNLENIISLNAKYLILKQEDAFDDKNFINEMKNYPIHIYLICKSPKILLDNERSIINEDFITLTFYTNLKGVRKDIVVKTINNKNHLIKRIECEYPFNFYKTYNINNRLIGEGKTNLLFKNLTNQNGDYFEESNLEVLYVGQAFGKNGERITIDRLKNHEKAQKIYFDTQNNHPDEEIWFLSLIFEPTLVTMFNPKFHNLSTIDKDLEHQIKVETQPIPFDQQITIIEASLITYFETKEYNIQYLNFPSKTHVKYSELFALDFNSVHFDLLSDNLLSKLYSNDVEPKLHHSKTYFLHNGTEREEMLSWYK